MRTFLKDPLHRGTLMVALGLALLAGSLTHGVVGCAPGEPTPAAKVNDVAADAKLEALQPRLEQLAADEPTLAPEIARIIDGWGTRPEETSYHLVSPLLNRYLLAHPDDQEAVQRLMASWRRRLDAFAAVPGV